MGAQIHPVIRLKNSLLSSIMPEYSLMEYAPFVCEYHISIDIITQQYVKQKNTIVRQ